MKKLNVFLLLFFLLTSCNERQVRIACIGDSITEGAGIKQQNLHAYPALLDSMFAGEAKVLNLGRGGTATQKNSDFSFWDTKEFSNLFVCKPEVVLVKLGTNDTKPQNWNRASFENDYQALIDTIKSMNKSPQIVLCLPVPVYDTLWGINDSVLQAGVIPTIRLIAEKNQLQLIDLNAPLQGYPEFFPDNVHPNEAGSRSIAKTIFSELKLKK